MKKVKFAFKGKGTDLLAQLQQLIKEQEGK